MQASNGTTVRARFLRGSLREVGQALGVFALAFFMGWATSSLNLRYKGAAWSELPLDSGLEWGMLAAVVLATLHVAGRLIRTLRKASDPDKQNETIASGGMALLFALLILHLIGVGIGEVAGFFQDADEQLPARAEPVYSYGPADANDLDLVLAPGVSVDILPSAMSLASRRFEEFDVSPAGNVLVRDETRLLDMISGDEVGKVPAGVHSFAFFGDTLALVTEDGDLGFLDGEIFQRTGAAPSPNTRLAASSDSSRLLLYRRDADESGASAAIVSLPTNGTAEALSGSPAAIWGVGGDAFQTLYAQGRSLYRITAPGRPQLLFTLPDEAGGITGVLVAGQAVYFSTRRAVYILDQGLALPLVIGIGGALRAHRGDLYLLDDRSGRVFRIARNGGGQS